MRHRSKPLKVLIILVCISAMISLFSFIVMSLWNAILPAVLHVSTISFWQAMGILVLSKILFGSFGGGWRGRRPHWNKKMFNKWQELTPEEREKFKQSWKERCERWGRARGPWAPQKQEQTGEPGAE